MSARIVKRALMEELRQNVEKNLDRYRTGNFDDLLVEDRVREIKSVSFDLEPLKNLAHESGGEADAGNAFLVHESLGDMTPYLANDERVWVWFTHGPCLEFTRRRWLGSDGDEEQLAKDVRLHFFARGSRGITRNNAIASLWWWAHIASRYERAELRETLRALLSNTDVRANIIERPTMARSSKSFSAIMDIMKSPPGGEDFFARPVYREWFRKINMHGGLRMLDALSESDLRDLFAKLAAEAVKEA